MLLSFTSTETIRTVMDKRQPRTATSTFTQLLSSECPSLVLSSRSPSLYVHKDHKDSRTSHLDFHTSPELCSTVSWKSREFTEFTAYVLLEGEVLGGGG